MRWLPAAPDLDALLARYGEAYKWIALAVVGTGIIASVFATTSFNVAVPALGSYFGLGQHQVQWAITGFLAALTLAMLPTPWLIERVGFRRLFLGGNLMLALASVAGALGTDFGFVVAMRVLQGVAAGLLQPLTIMVVMRHFPASSQGRAHGMIGFGIVLAPAAAPSLAGVLLDRFGWQS
ncbi:MAG: MFS transporter, partial [Proteobacteria bacterium]|nr:MFS transporter [Pseudomonadota bacterium]